jgi:hypothetical protein
MLLLGGFWHVAGDLEAPQVMLIFWQCPDLGTGPLAQVLAVGSRSFRFTDGSGPVDGFAVERLCVFVVTLKNFFAKPGSSIV